MIRPIRNAALALTGLALALPALAKVKLDVDAELVFLLFDHTSNVSYAKDLGLVAKDFWVTAQQDAGYSLFIEIDKTLDPQFSKFLTASTDSSKQRWGVQAGSTINAEGQALKNEAYTTLRNGSASGVVNSNWFALTSLNNAQFENVVLGFTSSKLGGSLNAQAVDSTHRDASVANGSSFSVKERGDIGFLGQLMQYNQLSNGESDGGCWLALVCMDNAVGQSSWFYKAAVSSEEGFEPLVADEFDNLGADGYWGLAIKPSNGNYVLSYTLAAHTPTAQVSTAEGRTRLSFTDYSASYGAARLVDGLDGEFAGWQAGGSSAVSAVPEPQSWLLMGLGLAGVAGWARRRQRSRQG